MDMFCFVKYGERYSVFQKLFSCVMQLESPKTLESFCFLGYRKYDWPQLLSCSLIRIQPVRIYKDLPKLSQDGYKKNVNVNSFLAPPLFGPKLIWTKFQA